MSLGKLEFCRHYVHLNGEPISFADRPYLPAVYAVNAGNLVIRASRQVEKSTFLANTIAYECCRNERAKVLVVLPREEQAHSFFHDRLLPLLEKSPVLNRALLGEKSRVQVNNLLNNTRVNGYSGVITSPLFGKPTSYGAGRTIQVGLQSQF